MHSPRSLLSLAPVLLSAVFLAACPSDDGNDETPTPISTGTSSGGETGGCFPDQTACGEACCDVTEVCEAGACVPDNPVSDAAERTSIQAKADPS